MQTNYKNDITQPVIFNTPKTLNLSELFPGYSKDKLDKVRYIVHQCNYYSNKSGYNLDMKNHRWFLSLTFNDLIFIKKFLIENNIIKLRNHSGNGISEHYTIVQPYNYLNEETVNKHFFYLNDAHCPLWVQRYVADDSSVRNAITTSWVKRPDNWQPVTGVQPVTVQANDREAYIQLLELTLVNNNIALPIYQSAPATSVIIEPDADIALTPAIAAPELNMGVAHDEPDLSPALPVGTELQPDLPPVDKAIQMLAGLRKAVKKVESPVVVPQNIEAKKVETISTDVHSMEGFVMVNYKRYKRATQLSDNLQRMQFERKLKQLVEDGYQGAETFTTENWLLSFNVDGLSRNVTLLEVLDAKLVA